MEPRVVKMIFHIVTVILSGLLFEAAKAQDIAFPEYGQECDGVTGKGSCREFTRCPSIRYLIGNGIAPVHCGFHGRMPLVCCPELAELKSGDTSVVIKNTTTPN